MKQYITIFFIITILNVIHADEISSYGEHTLGSKMTEFAYDYKGKRCLSYRNDSYEKDIMRVVTKFHKRNRGFKPSKLREGQSLYTYFEKKAHYRSYSDKYLNSSCVSPYPEELLVTQQTDFISSKYEVRNQNAITHEYLDSTLVSIHVNWPEANKEQNLDSEIFKALQEKYGAAQLKSQDTLIYEYKHVCGDFTSFRGYSSSFTASESKSKLLPSCEKIHNIIPQHPGRSNSNSYKFPFPEMAIKLIRSIHQIDQERNQLIISFDTLSPDFSSLSAGLDSLKKRDLGKLKQSRELAIKMNNLVPKKNRNRENKKTKAYYATHKRELIQWYSNIKKISTKQSSVDDVGLARLKYLRYQRRNILKPHIVHHKQIKAEIQKAIDDLDFKDEISSMDKI